MKLLCMIFKKRASAVVIVVAMILLSVALELKAVMLTKIVKGKEFYYSSCVGSSYQFEVSTVPCTITPTFSATPSVKVTATPSPTATAKGL